MILLRALQVWQLGDCFANNLERSLDLFLSDDEWWCEANDVLVCWLGLLVVS
jgi:hypothetical protein